MADTAVVQLFEARLELGSPSIPFLQTLNERPSALANVWTSIEQDHSNVERIGLGVPSAFREIGSIIVVIHVRAGTGVDAARSYVDAIRDMFHNYAVDHFRVTTVGSEFTVDPDDGSFFQLKFPVEYNFDFFKI